MFRDHRLPGHLNRLKDIFLYLLCTGHTCLTHSYQINSGDIPRCVAFDCDLTGGSPQSWTLVRDKIVKFIAIPERPPAVGKHFAVPR